MTVYCNAWEIPHCDSCHEDADSWGFELMDYRVGDVTLMLCCRVARALGLAE